MKNELTTVVICITVITLAAISSLSYYNINDRKLMASNIENAISKGVDPLSVRCSYATSSDTICVAYAASHGSQSFPTKK
jgi:hypothetical protein